jgi:hypothetical protein
MRDMQFEQIDAIIPQSQSQDKSYLKKEEEN